MDVRGVTARHPRGWSSRGAPRRRPALARHRRPRKAPRAPSRDPPRPLVEFTQAGEAGSPW